MIHRDQRRVILPVFLLILTAFFTSSYLHAQVETKGQRVFFSGHSFHYFMPPILADIAKKAEIKDHTQVGLSAIGGSRVYQHWNAPQTAVAKASNAATLPTETITVGSTAQFPKSGKIIVQTADGDVEVAYTDKTPTTFTGCTGGKGTLSAGKKVGTATNPAKDALKSGKLDVFTMAPIYLPDDGIEKFVKLGIDNNPKIRILVQENWLPWDHYDVAFKPPVGKVDHNAPTGEALRKTHETYFKAIDEHVAALNKKYGTTAVRVAPVGQAVIKLREKIIAGEAPGLKEQNDLFTDPIGHARPPLQALVAYCYYALIYEKSPVGLPVPAILAKADQGEKLNELLQRIAWEAVTSHPLSGVKAGKR
jgi:hypothetical protein